MAEYFKCFKLIIFGLCKFSANKLKCNFSETITTIVTSNSSDKFDSY